MRDSGIWAIVNTENGKVYVSASSGWMAECQANYKRWLSDGVFYNASLQEAWQQSGEGVFEFEVLEAVGPEGLAERKQHWIDFYRMRGGVYNSLCNGKHSEEMRRRMSEVLTGREVSAETRRRISEAEMGKRLSAETRDKLAKPYPAFRNERTGEMIPAGRNLRALCRSRGLDQFAMWGVVHGKRRQCQGWVLAEGMG